MNNRIYIALLFIGTVMIQGCDNLIQSYNNMISVNTCSDERTQESIIHNAIKEVATNYVLNAKDDNDKSIFDAANVRASVPQLLLKINDVRTTKADPNSKKKFCESVLEITVPPNVLNDATIARKLANQADIVSLARKRHGTTCEFV